MKPNSKLMVCAGGLAVMLALPASGQSLVKNPSFESSIPETWPFYGSIDEWTNTGGQGGVNEAGGPFHNNGTPIPDGRRVAFHQGAGAVAQDITGLVPGKRYWIQFRYDARTGSDLDLTVKFSTINQGGSMDETLETLLKVKPANLTGAPYYTRTVPFTPDFDSGTLTFEVAVRGDSTVLLDAVTIVQRDEGNFAVMNPSFEASGTVYAGAPSVGTDWPAVSSWAKVGVAGVDDGTGGQADNGTIPEQGLVVFLSDQASLAQTLSPLVPADDYQLSFAYNAKTGTTPHLQVLVNGTVAWEKDVTAVGGAQPYAKQTVTFKAAAATAQVTFSNTVAGATVLLDEVKVLGKTGSTLPPMEMSPVKLAMRVGDEVTGTITLPSERLAQGPAVIKLRSGNTGVFVLPDADATGILTLTFEGATTSQPYKLKGAGVGNAVVVFTDFAGVPAPTDITAVFVAGTTFVLNPSFEVDKDSGVATAPVAGWTTAGANIGMAGAGNPFLAIDDLTIPDRRQVLRIQGGGGTVSQMIKGLKVGQLYGLQFFYNGRTEGYPYELALQVSFAGQQLANIQNIIPAAQNGLLDYYSEELRFTAAATSGLLEFKTVVTAGDATLFLDGVSIVPRLANEIAVRNSSFEASAMGANWPGYLQPERLAGWLPTGGYGVNGYSPETFFVEPFLDNGINSDQDNAFFVQNAGTIRQTVSGLTAGQTYTLVFDYNFRDGRAQNSAADPNLGQLELTLDGGVAFTSEDLPPVDTITPWPGFWHTKPFYQAFVPFTASAETAELLFSHIGVTGDETMLLENVRIMPGTRTPPAITKQLENQDVKSGAAATFSTTATGNNLSYRWYLNGVLLVDATTPTLTIPSAQTSDAGTYSVLVTDGLGVVGSTAALTVEAPPATASLAISRLTDGNVRIAWPAAATEFRLQSATAVTGTYTDDSSTIIVEGTENMVIVAPQGAAKFFRLAN